MPEPGSQSELPLERELPQEELEKKKRIQVLQNCLGNIEHGTPRYDHPVYDISRELGKIGEKDLAIDSFKIALYNGTEILKNLHDERQDIASGLYHNDSTRPVYDSYNKLSKLFPDLKSIKEFDILGKEMSKLYALELALQTSHQKAASIYESIGEVEKATEEAIKPKGDFSEDEQENNRVFRLAVEEFFKKVEENNLFKSQEERDAVLEKLKTDIQNKINNLLN